MVNAYRCQISLEMENVCEKKKTCLASKGEDLGLPSRKEMVKNVFEWLLRSN